MNRLSRRAALRNLCWCSGAVGAWGALPGITAAFAQQNFQRRLLVIFLDGGWNSHLAVDPVVGVRRLSGNFEDVYNSHEIISPNGKDNLLVGLGMQSALAAFKELPTAFFNGLNIDIPAHDTAKEFMLTGKNLVGRQALEPALPAIIAAARGGFASHIVLGGTVPLGTTFQSAPPIVTSGDSLGDLLAPPGIEFKAETRAILERSLAKVDDLYARRLGPKGIEALKPFRASQSAIGEVFERYGTSLVVGEELRSRYKVDENFSFVNLAATYLAFLHGLTTVSTVMIGGFDTHTNELGQQLPLQQSVGEVLATFVADLVKTEDPHNPGQSLADTTNILMTSEFVRTPKFNGTSGTDHQNSSSAILMGPGVKDNCVFGATDALGLPLGWEGDRSAPLSDETKIDAGSLVATILDGFGMNEQAALVSEKRIAGVFV